MWASFLVLLVSLATMAYSVDPQLFSNSNSPNYWPSFLSSTPNYTIVYDNVVSDVAEIFTQDYQKWVFSITGCVLVGLTGILPLLIFPHKDDDTGHDQSPLTTDSKSIVGKVLLNRLLNFAVGSLLGDVFLHLLPEAWNHARASGSSKHDSLMFLGFWILIGLVSFLICEKLIQESERGVESQTENSSKITDTSNNNITKISKDQPAKKSPPNIQVAGYLNLVANAFDNFTHGLAVAGSFIVSPKIGLLTTIAILLHEIPHEIADFAILIKSGFNRWNAAKAQLSTASIGLIGAIATLSIDRMETLGECTWWILPFTSGCFLNISLTHLLPDLIKEEESPKESAKQFASLLLGIAVMGALSLLHEG